MNKSVKGYLYGITASSSYGMNPLFSLPLIHIGIGVNSILFYRYFFAVLIYFFWVKFIKKRSLKLNIKEFISLFMVAILFSLSSVTLFDSFIYIESGIACTILFIYPIIVAIIMAVFFKEKITRTIILAIILTSIGIILLYKGGNEFDLNTKGIILVLLSALCYALYIVLVKTIKLLKNMNIEKLTYYVMLFGLTVYIYNLKFCTELQIIKKPIMWLLPVGLAIFPTIISIETISLAIKYIGPTSTAILGALEPITAIILGNLIFQEQLTIRIIIGIIMILCGVSIIILGSKKQTKNRKC